MFLFLVCWLVLSVVGGIFVGKAISRADAMELRRAPSGRPTDDRPMPYAPRITASAPASPSGAIVHLHTRAA
jgi:hypothetical protein